MLRHEYVYEIPGPFDPKNTVRARKMHGRSLKKAIRAALIFHATRTMKKHFEQHAAMKYKHEDRSRLWKVKKWKKHRSRVDLVASKKTKQKMSQGFSGSQIRVGGSVMSTEPKVVGTLTYRFPFPTSSAFSTSPRSISVHDMARELERWTDREKKDAAKFIRNKYVRNVREELRRTRNIRIRIRASSSAGIY